MLKPLAVLTRLEDSPITLDRRLLAAYLRTIYRVLNPAFDICIGTIDPNLEMWLNRQSFSSFCFLTAANPGSNLLSDQENKIRNEELLQAIQPLVPISPFPAVHISADANWPAEESWWIPGLSAQDALVLANTFGQNAFVFWEEESAVAVWWL